MTCKLCLLFTLVSITVRAEGPFWIPLFDGRTLTGWAATNMTPWSVRDGTITASSDTAATNRSCLVWQGGRPQDFELKLKFRILGGPQAAAGVQFRSTVRPDGSVEGYQAEMARDEKHGGILYDETPKRGRLAQRGQRIMIDERGNRTTVRFADGWALWRRIKLDGWNDYHIRAIGPTLSAEINGFEMWEVTDRDPGRGGEMPGAIALQMHSGPAMTVQFKDILLKDYAATNLTWQNPFFALCMDTHDAKKRSLQEQAALLKELGYDGAGHLWLDGVPERLSTLDSAGLKLFQIYLRVNIGPEAKDPWDPRLKEILPLLRGRDTMLAAQVQGGKPSDEALDARAVDLLRQLAGLAGPHNVKVALYPHAGDWLERMEDAMRVAGKVNRENLGVMFNLCHWLRTDTQRNYRPLLEQALPMLFAVSINGADEFDAQPGWGRYIQPLDSGSFNVRPLLETLRELGFTGPVGLQCYGLPGDAREHLARSIAAWRKLNRPLPETR